MSVIDELLLLERRGWESLCEGTGAEFYGSLMTDDALMVLASGAVMDRRAVVASLSDAPAWDEYAIDDVRTVEVSDGVACLVYTGTGRRGDTTFVGVMSSTYVRAGNGWMLALYQQSRQS